jgi:hypothetical protein
MLNIWDAVSFRCVLESGRTKPLVVECIEVPADTLLDQSDVALARRKEFVVKALGNPEVDKSLIIRELLGNLLARSYGLATPEPGLIRISETFASSVNPLLSTYGFQIRPGSAAGCEFLRDGFSPPSSVVFFTPEEVGALALLYGFDLASQNPDRRAERPNCGVKGSTLIAFDFDQCFSFLYLLGTLGEPWEVSKHGIAPNHFSRARLKSSREPISWADNVNALLGLTDQVMTELTAWIPDDWIASCQKIQAHFGAIREHLGEFEIELQGSLI